jgi:glycosyltransferase involved in cell wall biosynthesis
MISTYDDHPRFWGKQWLKSYLYRHLIDGVFYSGIRAYQYCISMGFKPEVLWRTGNVVDNEHFRRLSDEARKSGKTLDIYKDIPSDYFLYCGRLTPTKNIPFLLKAYENYLRGGGKKDLVIVGSGPLFQDLQKQAEAIDSKRIHLLPWLSYDELPVIYAHASCLILPSLSEPWGLVVNEAMACGLPVIVSRKCGCSPELCWRGVNGYDIAPDNDTELTELLFKMSSPDINLREMGCKSQQIISDFSLGNWARALKDCLETFISRSN